MFITLLAQAPAPSPAGPNPLASFVPIILIFVIMYFLLFRPQMKRQKEQAVARQGPVDRFHGQRPVDCERLEGEREDDRVAQRQHRKLARIGPYGIDRHIE